ncbi:MAG: calcium-binding protein [Microvirga sp.]|jgi:hypothetical protein|nr:calcium-binding protein [Microvirga sp.]
MTRAVIPIVVIAIAMGLLPASAQVTPSVRTPLPSLGGRLEVAQAGRSCKAASTCREAVEMWCGGYKRADADSDGIPCGNVCRSVNQVEAIKEEIGC